MKRRGWLPAAAAALLVSHGTPGLAADEDNASYLELTGRYVDLINAVEGRYAKGEAPAATTLGPLCIAYARVKRYADLASCADKLEARVKAGDTRIKHLWATVADANATPLPEMLRAEADLELGDFGKSIAEGTRALALVPAGGYDGSFWPPVKYRLTLLADLAVASALAGQDKEAGEFIARLRDESIPFFGSSNWAPVKKNGLARAYMATKQYEKVIDELGSGGYNAAVLVMSDALSHAGWVKPDDSIRTIFELPKLFMLGKSKMELGRSEEAKEDFDRILANPRVKDVGDIYWLTLYERGRLAYAGKDGAKAIALWKNAIEVIEAQRATLASEGNKIGFAGDKQAVYQALVQALFAAQLFPEAFDYVERSKSRALVDILAKQTRFSAPGADAGKVQALLSSSARAELDASSLFVEPGGAAPAERRSLAIAQVRQSVQSASPELASLVSVTSAPLAEIQAHLGADEALVEYYYTAQTLYSFVVTGDSLSAYSGPLGSLEADIRALREALESPASESYLAPSQRLAKQLLPPIESSGRKNVVVVAHGLLHYLPFSVLHDGKSFLIDRFGLRLLPSASVLKYLRHAKAEKPGGILAFGDPDVGDPRLDLKFAEQEALAVVKTVPRSKALVRRDATEEALREYASQFRYLHFATHGKFDPQDPLQSALLLSGQGPSLDLLTVGKLYAMRLDVDLVALSACETGLGKVANGDDVIGLTRGFLYAGAGSIIASLWQVDDQATAALMTRFYENLARESKRDALRDAQLEVRKQFPHPFFWAAFQLTGNAD